MVKKEIKEIIRKRLNVVKGNKDKELLEKYKAEIPEEVKGIASIYKKMEKIDKKVNKLSIERDVLCEELTTFSKRVKISSKDKLTCDGWNRERIVLNHSSKFDVYAEFDKIEEELILSEDEGGTLKEIFEKISKM